jgi:ubiquinone/menaquinone biosynthesis C-methylase UbiE
MSLSTRHFFDRIQNSSLTKFRLPSPPYYDPSYWDRAYKDATPDDCIEWGGFDLNRLLKFRWERISLDEFGFASNDVAEEKEGTSTFAEWLDIQQHESPEEASSAYQQRKLSNDSSNDAILLLGCGNSKMGEQLLIHSFQGPFLQLDVSSKLIQCMTQRYDKYLKEAAVKRMEFIVDDATELTSLEPNSVGGAVIDKGLFDGLHCALPNVNLEIDDGKDSIRKIMESVHRVLQPSRPFVFFSRSSPEYMLRRSFGDDYEIEERRRRWKDVSVIKLVDLDVMLYRFVKAEENNEDVNLRVTTRAFRMKKRPKRN